MLEAELTVTLSCTLQLISGLDLIDPNVAEHESRTAIVRGYYNLQLYANDHWLDHLLGLSGLGPSALLGTTKSAYLCSTLEQLALKQDALASRLGIATQNIDEIPAGPKNLWNMLKLSSTSRQLVEKELGYLESMGKKVGNTVDTSLCESLSTLAVLSYCCSSLQTS